MGDKITLYRVVKTSLMDELTYELKKSAMGRSGRIVQGRKNSWYQGLEMEWSLLVQAEKKEKKEKKRKKSRVA